MNKVTSSYKRRESLTLGDMKVGDYVLTYGTYCLVTAGGEHGVVTKALADGSEISRQAIEVERVPLGTVITIVVGGEKSDDAAPQYTGHSFQGHEILLEHKPDEIEVAAEFRQRYGDFIAGRSDAEFNAADVLMQFICLHLHVDQQSESNEDVEIFCNEFGLDQPHEDWEDRLTAARKREEETENRQLTDAEFLDSLRGRGINVVIDTKRGKGDYFISLRDGDFKQVFKTFSEAVQWLREKVDG